MPTYLADADLTKYLPTSLPASIDTSGERATYITGGSARAESAVGARFGTGSYTAGTQKFPDVSGDTTATPPIIVELASMYGVALILRKAYGDGAISSAIWREWEDTANELARQIREGEAEVLDSAGTVYGTRTRILTQHNAGAVPTFTRGEYDVDGNLASDQKGTLDGL